jgi:hypothetical protein
MAERRDEEDGRDVRVIIAMIGLILTPAVYFSLSLAVYLPAIILALALIYFEFRSYRASQEFVLSHDEEQKLSEITRVQQLAE